MLYWCLFTDNEPCTAFSKTLRRIVRTFDRAGETRLGIAYVRTSLHKKRFVSIVSRFSLPTPPPLPPPEKRMVHSPFFSRFCASDFCGPFLSVAVPTFSETETGYKTRTNIYKILHTLHLSPFVSSRSSLYRNFLAK